MNLFNSSVVLIRLFSFKMESISIYYIVIGNTNRNKMFKMIFGTMEYYNNMKGIKF